MGSEIPRGEPRMASKSPLLRLSLELRLMIYEYAVQLNWDLTPSQLGTRSNKFTHYQINYYAKEGRYYTTPMERTLTNTQLLRTCKQIHQDLTAYPVFYRINRFVFSRPSSLHRFLAALTSKRRRNIRHILLLDDRLAPFTPEWENMGVGSHMYDSTTHGPILTLLRDCRELREIKFVIRVYYWSAMIYGVLNLVEGRSAETIPSEARSLWHLPGFDMRLEFEDFSMHLNSGAIVLPERFKHRERYLGYFRKVRLAFLDHQAECRRLREQNQPLYPTDEEVFDACEAAGLDFPGEFRITQQRSSGFRDMVSRRTRKRVRDESNADERGTLMEEDPKYDSEGVLMWEHYFIDGIRRNGEVIECLVARRNSNGLKPSWEELHRFARGDHLDHIMVFYDSLYRNRHYRSTTAQLIARQEVLEPEEVGRELLPLILDPQPRERLSRWRKTCKLGLRDVPER